MNSVGWNFGEPSNRFLLLTSKTPNICWSWTDVETHASLLPVCTGWSPVAPQAALTSVIRHPHYHPSLKTRDLDSCALQLWFVKLISVSTVCRVAAHRSSLQICALWTRSRSALLICSDAAGLKLVGRKLWCQEAEREEGIKLVIEPFRLAGAESEQSPWISVHWLKENSGVPKYPVKNIFKNLWENV